MEKTVESFFSFFFFPFFSFLSFFPFFPFSLLFFFILNIEIIGDFERFALGHVCSFLSALTNADSDGRVLLNGLCLSLYIYIYSFIYI